MNIDYCLVSENFTDDEKETEQEIEDIDSESEEKEHFFLSLTIENNFFFNRNTQMPIVVIDVMSTCFLDIHLPPPDFWL